jgi:hypothetical protein
MDDAPVGGGRMFQLAFDAPVHGGKQVVAPMHVANGVEPHAVRPARVEIVNADLGQGNVFSASIVTDKLEQFQEKCETVFRPELRKNKEIERFGDSVEC